MTSTYSGLVCPAPRAGTERVMLGHGSGGKLSAALLRDHFLPQFTNPVLDQLGDGAVVTVGDREVVLSTDSFVVSPLEFPGGNIGALAVNGTLNDVSMMGARPCFLTASFVIEEGLPLSLLDRIVATMAREARAADVLLITGDTKVVERGKADGLFINTTGLGVLEPGFRPAPGRAAVGDAILVSAPLGRHGMAIMAAREGLEFKSTIESDTANLWPLVERLRQAAGDQVKVLRDPTRGGLASSLNEIAAASHVGIELFEARIDIPPDVQAACEMLGLDPLYVANEGVLAAFVAPDRSAACLAALRAHPLGARAAIVGRVVEDHPELVVLRTAIGGTRVVDLLPGDQLPRIC
jgi:hydrogenase expression/formation protein HypE